MTKRQTKTGSGRTVELTPHFSTINLKSTLTVSYLRNRKPRLTTMGITFPGEDDVSVAASDDFGESSNMMTERSGEDSEDPSALREVKELAMTETKRMRQWKFLVVTAIILTAAVVSYGIHSFMSQQQADNFKSQVSTDAVFLV